MNAANAKWDSNSIFVRFELIWFARLRATVKACLFLGLQMGRTYGLNQTWETRVSFIIFRVSLSFDTNPHFNLVAIITEQLACSHQGNGDGGGRAGLYVVWSGSENIADEMRH
jgi:hypothetical protein